MGGDKKFTAEELSDLGTPDNLHLLIHGKVYAIAKFMEEHPGGDEVLLNEAGKDATESFEDVGHSEEARQLMNSKFLVGTCDEKPTGGASKKVQQQTAKPASKSDAGSINYLLPLAALIAYLGYRWYQQQGGLAHLQA